MMTSKKILNTHIAIVVSSLICAPTNAALIALTATTDDGGAGCTLREAISSLESESLEPGCLNFGGDFGDNDTINTLIFGSATITLVSQLEITKDMVINGSGRDALTISGNSSNRVFEISNSADVSINDLKVSAGREIRGGGLHISGSSQLHMKNCIVSGNSGTDGGGGLSAHENAEVILLGSTFSENSTSSRGGGISTTASELEVINSTFSGNRAALSGAGVRASISSIVRITNSTLTNNSAGSIGGGVFADNSTVILSNTIVSGNLAPSGAELAGNPASNFFNTRNLLGNSNLSNAVSFYNVAPSAFDINATSDGDLVSDHRPTPLSSILLPLADNGGPTLTHALGPRSPAISRARFELCPDLDQRGETRKPRCDIGSFDSEDDSVCFVVKTKENKVVTFCL